MGLEDYKDIVATAAGITTVAQCFAPAFICKTIVKKGSTQGVDPLPFIGGLIISVLMLQHGVLLNDPAMIPVNIFAFGLNLCYLACYYFYCSEKGVLFTTLAKAVAFIAAIIGYAQYEQKELIEFRFGLIVTVLMLSVIGAPLLSLGEIVKTKNTESLPFPLIVSGTVVTSLWLLYGFIIKNLFVQVQNTIFLTLNLMQLIIFFIFINSSNNSNDEPKPDEANQDPSSDASKDDTNAADKAKSEDTKKDEPSADAPKEDATPADAAKTEPAPDAAKTEPSPDAAKTEPAPEAGKTEPAPDAAKTEPTPEAGKTEPAPDAAKTEPTPDTGKTESAPDTAKTEPSPDSTKAEPAPDASNAESAPDASKAETATDATKPEPSPDSGNTEPAPDAAKTEPAADASKSDPTPDGAKTQSPADSKVEAAPA